MNQELRTPFGNLPKRSITDKPTTHVVRELGLSSPANE